MWRVISYSLTRVLEGDQSKNWTKNFFKLRAEILKIDNKH